MSCLILHVMTRYTAKIVHRPLQPQLQSICFRTTVTTNFRSENTPLKKNTKNPSVRVYFTPSV